MNSNPLRMSFASRFCITLVATLLLALFPKGASDSSEQTAEVSDQATSSVRLVEMNSITEQRSEGPPTLAPN